MEDKAKTKERLIKELAELRRRIAGLEKLETKPERLEQVLKAVTDPMNVLDRDLRILWANEARAKMHQRSVDEMMGQYCYEMFQRRSEVCEDCPVIETFRTGNPCTRERFADLPDGTRVWAESHAWPIFDENGEAVQVVQYARDITERKRVEEEVERTRDFLTNLTNSIDDGLFVIEEDYTISYANEAVSRQTGMGIDEIIGQPCYRISHHREEKCQPPEHECPLDTVFETKLPKVVLHTHFDKAGNPFWVEIRCSPIFDERGEVARVVEVARDVTKRKEAEEALQESEEKFRNISASAQDAIILMDNEGSVSYWNETAEKIFLYNNEEVIGKKLHELIIPHRFRESHLRWLDEFGKTGKGAAIGRMLEIVAIRKEGEEFPIELSLSAVKIKGNWNAIGIVRDITERKRAEEALRSLKEFNENVVQSIQDGLVALDRDFRITFWNSAMESISGCTVSEAQGKNIFDVLSCLTQGGVGEQLEGALEGQVTERSNIPCPTSDGKTIYWNTKHLPLRDSEGEVVGVLVVVEDVTEVLHLEQRLARLQEEIEQRKFVEIAKGILMRQLNLSEAESYQFIQKKSQDENKKMGEVAKEVIEFFGSADEREKFGKDIPE